MARKVIGFVVFGLVAALLPLLSTTASIADHGNGCGFFAGRDTGEVGSALFGHRAFHQGDHITVEAMEPARNATGIKLSIDDDPADGYDLIEVDRDGFPGMVEYAIPVDGEYAIHVLALGENSDLDGDGKLDGVGITADFDCVPGASSDTTSPTWSNSTLIASTIRSDGFTLEWSGANDDVGVVSYEVLIGGSVVEVVTAPATSATVSGLTPDTEYGVQIQALDGAGNRSKDGPNSKISTASELSTSTFLSSPLDPDQAWQANLPTDLLDLARAAEEIVLVTSAGSAAPKMTRLTPFIPSGLDLDDDGIDDAQVTIKLGPGSGPGVLPVVTLTVGRLVEPGPSAVQIVALIPLPPELATTLGQSTMVVGFGTTGLDGAFGGNLPLSESIRVSLDSVDGLFHRFGLTFTTVGDTNPLEFYAGTAEGENAAGGANAANLLGMHVSNPPPLVTTEVSVDASLIGASDPKLSATWMWRASSRAAEPDVTFAYLESDRRRRGTVADYDTRVFVAGMDPETSLSATLIPDDSLEIVLRHNNPGNDPPSGTFYDELDVVEFRHERSDGLSIRAGFDSLIGDEMTLRLDDGTGDLSIVNQRPVDIEFEASRPGRGFITGFSNPIDWVFASIQNTKQVVVSTSDLGDVEVTFGTPSDRAALTFVATDDPADILFPADQTNRWPAGPPQGWRALGGWNSPAVRLGVVDNPEGSTIALRTKNSTGFRFGLDPATLAQSIALGVASDADLDIDVELEPGSIVSSRLSVGCRAQVKNGDVGFDIESPGRYTFRSAGGDTLFCRAESQDRHYLLSAETFPERMTFELTTAEDGLQEDGLQIEVVAVDGFGEEAPITEAMLVVNDEAGLTGSEPLGTPATYLAVGAVSLPSSTLGWSRTDAVGTVIDFTTSGVEDGFQDLKAVLTTNHVLFAEPFARPAGADLDHWLPGNVRVEFLPDGQHSFRLWQTPLSSVLAGGTDATTHARVNIDPDGIATVDLDSTATRWLTTELGLPASGHFTPETSIEGWCHLKVPDGTNRFVVDVPTTVTFATSNPLGFESMECSNRIGNEDSRTDLSMDVAGSSIADQTEILVDLRGGFAQLIAPVAPVGSLSVDLSDLTGRGLIRDTAFSNPVLSLSLRADDAKTFVSTWILDPDRPVVDLRASQPVGSAQVRLSTNADPTPLPDPGTGHYVKLTDKGPDGVAEIAAGMLDLEFARFTMDRDADLPLTVSADSSAPHPLDVEIFVGFQSQLAPVINGDSVEIHAEVSISEVTSARYTSDLRGVHHVTGADGADLVGEITIDGLDGEGKVLAVDIEAINLPRVVGIDAFGLVSDAAGSSAIAELSGPLESLDIVLRDGRASGVMGTGSQRLRVRAEGVPTRLEFTMSGTGTEGDGALSGDLILRGALSSRLGRLLIESNRLHGREPHFGTPFSGMTIDLTDVPRFTDLIVSRDASSTGFDANLIFRSTEAIPKRPGPEDRLGAVEVVLERAKHGLDTDRGAPLLTYGDASFTKVTRSAYVRKLDDSYWSAEIRTKLDSLDGRGFNLTTRTVQEAVAADGQGATNRTHAVDDAVIISADRDISGEVAVEDLRLVAFRLTDVYSLDVSILPVGDETVVADINVVQSFHTEVRIRRPAQASGPPMYIAIEGDAILRYEKFDRDVSVTPPSVENRDPRIPDRQYGFEYGTADPSTGGYTLDVLGGLADTVDPETLSVFFPAAVGVASVDAGKIVYVPNHSEFVGVDDFIISACSRDDATQCALANVDLSIKETHTAGIYAMAESVPADFTVHFDETTLTRPDGVTHVPFEAGFRANTRPGAIDIFLGPRTLPPISSVPSTRVYISGVPTSFKIDLSDPDAVRLDGQTVKNPGKDNKFDLAFKQKIDTSGGVDLVGMSDTSGDKRMWYGVSGEDVEIETQAIGLIRHVLTGTRPDTEFRGCDRIFGKIDTCVTLLGVAIAGDFVGDETGEKLTGFFAMSPLSETSPGARANGAEDFEYLPLITAGLTEARSLSGSVQLQLEPFCTIQCEAPFLDLEAGVRIKAQSKFLDLWDRGFLGAVAFPSIVQDLIREASGVGFPPWRIVG